MTQQPERDSDGYYHVADANAPLPSVTTILGQELEKPGLEAWKERTDNWKRVRDRAALVGTLAHRRCLNPYAVRSLPVETMPAKFDAETIRTDVEVAAALWDDVKTELPINGQPYVEKTLWASDAGGYAGTADMITDGVVIDLKTSSGVYDSHKLQAAAYANAARVRDVDDVNRAAIVKLNYREPEAGITWLDAEDLDALYEQFTAHVENFHDQRRIAGPNN